MSSKMRKAMGWLGLSDDEYDQYSRPEQITVDQGTPDRPLVRAGADYSRGTTGIRPLARPETTGAATSTRPTIVRPVEPVVQLSVQEQAPVRVHVIEPIEFSDAQEIGDRLRQSQPVIVTMVDLDADLTRRLIDFCSGATYVLGGTMERVAKNVFLVTPSNVEVPPEEKRRLQERGLYRTS